MSLSLSFLCFQLSKEYGPVFQVFLGPQKVVVLAGFRTVKQALVSHAVAFGNREITPAFYDINKGFGNNVVSNVLFLGLVKQANLFCLQV